MTVKRSYEDSCGIARALDAVGERWALLVVRELLLGPKRFTDLRTGLPRIGPDMLAARLRELEDAGLVAQRRLAPPAARTVYELTPRGRELEPVLHALGRWGSRQMLSPDPPPLSPDAIVVAMQTMFEPDPAARPSVIGLQLDGHEFSLRADAERLVATAGPDAASAATVETDPVTLAAVLWHGLDIDRAIREGRLAIGGDRRAARSLLNRYG
ncbi:MAG: helix-turn-helix domain-containing protein [Solirubrobacteraceae bacterium]